MSRPLATMWTSHIKDPKKQKEFGELVLNSTGALTRLRDMIKQGGEGEDRALTTAAAMENPNWVNKVTFNMGKRDGEQRILKLLSFLDQ